MFRVLPINKCFRSYPVLSLRRVPSMSSTVPFAKTASRPDRLFYIKIQMKYICNEKLYCLSAIQVEIKELAAEFGYSNGRNRCP